MAYRGFLWGFLGKQLHESSHVYFHLFPYLSDKLGTLHQYFLLRGLDEAGEGGDGLVSNVVVLVFCGQKHTNGFPVKQNGKFLQILSHMLNVV